MFIAVIGATGRVGKHVVRQALNRGHTVRALTRSAPTYEHEGLSWVRGSVEDGAAVKALILDSDAAISAIGPSGKMDTCSVSTTSLIAAGVRRLIVVSGSGIDAPGDRKDVIGRVASTIVKWLSPQVFADKVKELSILLESDIDWTAARAGAILKGDEIKPVKVSLLRLDGNAINCASLAAFCIEEAEQHRYPRQAPFVGN